MAQRVNIFVDELGREVLEIGKDPVNQGYSIFVLVSEMHVFRGTDKSLRNKTVMLPFDMREWPANIQNAWIHGHAYLLEEYSYENLPHIIASQIRNRWAGLRSLTINQFTEIWRSGLSTSGLSAPMAKARNKKLQAKAVRHAGSLNTYIEPEDEEFSEESESQDLPDLE